MKKLIISIISILLMSATIATAQAKQAMSSDLATAIRLYKSQNYAECYTKLNSVIQSDPSNALAYYYMAMTETRIGHKTEAIGNYERAIALSSPGSNLNNYARKGKICLEDPEKCADVTYDSEEDKFIRSKSSPRFTDQVRSEYERLKINNLMREMNNSDDIPANEFREYRDFSTMNNGPVPTNDEIVAAIRTLQRAGMGNLFNNGYSDLSMLTGENRQNSLYGLMGNSNLSPQVIQAMLTNNMSLGF